MNAEIEKIKLQHTELLIRVRTLEKAVGIAQDLKDEDEQDRLPGSPRTPANASDGKPLSNSDLARAARSSHMAEAAMWNQYELLISLSDRLRDMNRTAGETRLEQKQQLDVLERNLGEIRDEVQALIGLLTKDD